MAPVPWRWIRRGSPSQSSVQLNFHMCNEHEMIKQKAVKNCKPYRILGTSSLTYPGFSVASEETVSVDFGEPGLPCSGA